MNIEVSPETAATIERLVATGQFGDAPDVVALAVRRMCESEDEYLAELRENILRSIADLDAGGGHVLTPELVADIKRRGRERLESRSQHSP